MADLLKEISDLPSATDLTAGLGDFLLIKQGDTDRKIRVADFLKIHTEDYNNPHQTNKTDVGLDKVNNWQDESDPAYTGSDRYANIAAVKALYDQIQNLTNNLLPVGTIILWSGAIVDIPSGFQLCDGTNGTPNLRNRFVVGAGDTYVVGSTGGVLNTSHGHTVTVNGTTLTWQQIPPHKHATSWGETRKSDSKYGVVEADGRNNAGSGDTDYDNYNFLTSDTIFLNETTSHDGADSHTHSASTNSATLENRPPYYALCYIMKI